MPIYRLLLTCAAPVLALLALWRNLRGRESLGDLGQRLGGGAAGGPGAIWVHGASNGELASARVLIEALSLAFPDRALVVTSNTLTARAMVQRWGLERVTARLAPVDLRPALARFRAHWRPAALIVLENEIWPNRIATAGHPVLVVAARMTEASAARWRRARFLTARLLPRIARLYPQDARSGERFVALGLPRDRLGRIVSLKAGVALAEPPARALAALAAHFDRPRTILAASTHQGEEALVIEAFATLRQTHPDLRLILAPRHPDRGAEVAALLQAAGLDHATRSEGQQPKPGAPAYLADTLGEMPLWYALAGIAVIGGSFAGRGGHTPFEPAQAGCALIHGPDTANFADSYAALAGAGAAVCVGDAVGLATAIGGLLDPERQAHVAHEAGEVLRGLDQSAQAIDEVVAEVRRLLG